MTSGFCANNTPCLVAIYTGHTPETTTRHALQTQNLAYSNDRGRTWTKYARNPVLDLHISDFRDPKVFWSQMAKHWVMAVSLPDDHKIRFYGSPDLKQWQALSDFGPAGAVGGQWECPELFELPVDAKESRWVLKVGLNPAALQGGSGEQYFIGRFDGARFVNDNPPSLTLWTDYGKDCYCALTLNNLPRTQPLVMMGWMNNWQYASDVPTHPWRGQMTVPRQLSLRRTPDGLRLFQQPIDAIHQLRAPHGPSGAFELQASIPLGNAQEVGCRLLSADGSFTLIGFDRERRQLFVDRTNSGRTSFNRHFAARTTAPLNLSGARLQLRVLVDHSSVEVFAEDGQVAITNLVFPPHGITAARFYSKGGATGQVTSRRWPLASIW